MLAKRERGRDRECLQERRVLREHARKREGEGEMAPERAKEKWRVGRYAAACPQREGGERKGRDWSVNSVLFQGQII